MRKLLILEVLLVLFIGIGLYTEYTIDQSSQQLAIKLEMIYKLVETSDWNQANLVFEEYGQAWTKAESWWALVTDHEEIDEISLGMERAKAYLVSKTQEDLLAELNALTYLIKHIPEKEKLSWSTLF